MAKRTHSHPLIQPPSSCPVISPPLNAGSSLPAAFQSTTSWVLLFLLSWIPPTAYFQGWEWPCSLDLPGDLCIKWGERRVAAFLLSSVLWPWCHFNISRGWGIHACLLINWLTLKWFISPLTCRDNLLFSMGEAPPLSKGWSSDMYRDISLVSTMTGGHYQHFMVGPEMPDILQSPGEFPAVNHPTHNVSRPPLRNTDRAY